MWIKICGITNYEDALHAVQCGANALGFIFALSPRHVEIQQVRAIIERLPDNVEFYGVFADASFDEIVSAVTDAGLTGVQLHANQDRALPLRLREHFGEQRGRRRVGIISVLHFKAAEAADDLDRQLDAFTQDHAVDAVLIDSRTAERIGGTGLAFDWAAARQTFLHRAPHLRLIAAGGLNPENVERAIHTLAPWGVDVVTGTESSPGKKDPARVARFVRNAMHAAVRQKEAGSLPVM